MPATVMAPRLVRTKQKQTVETSARASTPASTSASASSLPSTATTARRPGRVGRRPDSKTKSKIKTEEGDTIAKPTSSKNKTTIKIEEDDPTPPAYTGRVTRARSKAASVVVEAEFRELASTQNISGYYIARNGKRKLAPDFAHLRTEQMIAGLHEAFDIPMVPPNQQPTYQERLAGLRKVCTKLGVPAKDQHKVPSCSDALNDLLVNIPDLINACCNGTAVKVWDWADLDAFCNHMAARPVDAEEANDSYLLRPLPKKAAPPTHEMKLRRDAAIERRFAESRGVKRERQEDDVDDVARNRRAGLCNEGMPPPSKMQVVAPPSGSSTSASNQREQQQQPQQQQSTKLTARGVPFFDSGSHKTYFAVPVGRVPSIYTARHSAKPCAQDQTNKFKGAVFKGFHSLEEAEDFFWERYREPS
jgi:hypothetical protein